MTPDPTTINDLKADAAESAEPRRGLAVFAPTTRAQIAAGVLALMFLASTIGFLVGTRTADAAPAADSADVGFLFDMSAHHEQAVLLANLQLTRGSDPLVLSMAREILNMQSYEIGLMRMRLGTWGFPANERTQTPMAWMAMSVPHVDAMPGMATQDELAALKAASGAEADELFLALMSDHHAGGVAMAQAAADRAEDHWVIDTAGQMARIQASEIVEMNMARDAADLDPFPPEFVADFAPDDAAHDDMAMDSMDG